MLKKKNSNKKDTRIVVKKILARLQAENRSWDQGREKLLIRAFGAKKQATPGDGAAWVGEVLRGGG
jgi:hypothetical protein